METKYAIGSGENYECINVHEYTEWIFIFCGTHYEKSTLSHAFFEGSLYGHVFFEEGALVVVAHL